MIANSPGGFLRTALIVCALLFTGTAKADVWFDRMVVFGDSLSDPGNAFVLLKQVAVRPYALIPDAPYARGGLHFSNGKTWIEQLAQDIQLVPGAGPALQVPRVFTNYAVGGARARPGTLFDLSTQVGLFLGDFSGGAPADALYVVFVGGNDLRDAVAALAGDPSGGTSMTILAAAVGAVVDNITALNSAGAAHFLVANAPNLALVPAIRLQGPAVQAAAEALSAAYNAALAAALAALEAALPVTIHRLDVFSLINEIVASPETAGLTNVEAACITPDVIVKAECTRPDEYLFWDGIHPTRAGHALLARKAREVLGVH